MRDGSEALASIAREADGKYPDDIERAVDFAAVNAKRELSDAWIWDQCVRPVLRQAIREAIAERQRSIVTERRQRATSIMDLAPRKPVAAPRQDKPRQPPRTFGTFNATLKGGLAELVDGKAWGKHTLSDLIHLRDRKLSVGIDVVRKAWIAEQIIAAGRLQDGDELADKFSTDEMEYFQNQSESLLPDATQVARLVGAA